jgi:hypothetical protein
VSASATARARGRQWGWSLARVADRLGAYLSLLLDHVAPFLATFVAINAVIYAVVAPAKLIPRRRT